MDNKQLTRAVVLSLALAPVVTGRSYAVDAPIFYDDGGIYDYSDSVEIKELADSDMKKLLKVLQMTCRRL